MASTNAGKNDKSDGQRPRGLHGSKSFSRLGTASSGSSARSSRANTIQSVTIAETPSMEANDLPAEVSPQSTRQNEDDEPIGRASVDFDELPIELKSLTDSFIESLSAKVHPTPPSIEKLSSLFQDFYALSANHINTHISALSLRQFRGSSPSSTSSRASVSSRLKAVSSPKASKDEPRAPSERRESEQQLLTAEEIAERKKARRLLELKRIALEEVIERRVCEAVYDRIWRHRTTQDEAQDEVLQSRIAALAVVGIGLGDLGIVLHEGEPDEAKAEEVRKWLDGAREELRAMNSKKYPLGKLHHLKAAHKAIVDTLSHFHPSSSADEILPMLIYTLITSPPDETKVISNLYFIQRFRWEHKIDGEAAYCLTNLEAAISFLETVDLASLRADELTSGPVKTQSTLTNRTSRTSSGSNEAISGSSAAKPTSETAATKSLKSAAGLRPAIQAHNRRFSDLVNVPARAIGAAGDAVLNTADEGFKSIGNSLGDSYKFLVGKLKERQEGEATAVVLPKTLEDARKLIGTPPPQEDEDVASGASSIHSPEAEGGASAEQKPDDKILSFISGRRAPRDHSADSARSSSSKEMKEKVASPLGTAALAAASPLESMRNLGNTLNPMNRLPSIGMMRGFGRNPTSTPPVVSAAPAGKSIPDGDVADLTTASDPQQTTAMCFELTNAPLQAFPDLADSLPPKEPIKVAPPIKRFMEIQNPGELKLNEVLDLLRDYRRLATALKDLGHV